ncbi:MAG: hypothetical protein KGZ48_10815, partial [Dethiobacter sp.]|nr:hypothetical protein [Dethiobacter sp.]
GLSMSNRMTRELVINALDNAYKHAAKPKGVLIHSDRGSQYCSPQQDPVWRETGQYGRESIAVTHLMSVLGMLSAKLPRHARGAMLL